MVQNNAAVFVESENRVISFVSSRFVTILALQETTEVIVWHEPNVAVLRSAKNRLQAVSRHGRTRVILSRVHCTMHTHNMAAATLNIKQIRLRHSADWLVACYVWAAHSFTLSHKERSVLQRTIPFVTDCSFYNWHLADKLQPWLKYS